MVESAVSQVAIAVNVPLSTVAISTPRFEESRSVPSPCTRRQFLQNAALLGAGLWSSGGLSGALNAAANDRLRIACLGVGGQGALDAAAVARLGDVVAICDIDEQALAARAAEDLFARAKIYRDYRQLFEEMADGFDAFTVSLPNHTHAHASILGMRLGKHCFCQTPLAHSVGEVRQMMAVAKDKKLVTQLANPSSVSGTLKQAAALIESGALGTIREVHAWTNRPNWPQGKGIRHAAAEVPPSLHWDLFLGPAPHRAFAPEIYHPTNWRGWWDFGSGALGDQGCQLLDLPFRTLKLSAPTRIASAHSGHDRNEFPAWSVVRYEFPERGTRAPLSLFWYDGGKRPSRELFLGRTRSSSGLLIVGERDSLLLRDDLTEAPTLLHEQASIDAGPANAEPGPGLFEEWIQAIRGGAATSSDFVAVGGPLSETVLLGNLAVWMGPAAQTNGPVVEWDSESLSSPNLPELAPLIQPPSREGWSL